MRQLLRRRRLRCSLNGYRSSLSYLRSFPFDKIKIDRSFILGLAEQKACLAIIKAIAGLAACTGMATTAEGVETEEQFRHVRDQGCTEVQGYFFNKPRPPAELANLFLADAFPKAAWRRIRSRPPHAGAGGSAPALGWASWRKVSKRARRCSS